MIAKPDRDADLGVRVVRSVALELDVDVFDLPVLAESIDPDSLSRLVEQGSTVTFDYAGREITVDRHGVEIA